MEGNMVSNYDNQYLLDNTCLSTECQMLFFQKMKELLHIHSGISYSFKIHNSYTILEELLNVIIDYESNKINGMTVEEVRKEAKQIISSDVVIRFKYPELYEVIKEAVAVALKTTNTQAIDPNSIAKMHSIKETIKQLFHKFKPVDYLQTSLILTKNAIDNSEGRDVVALCQVIVSASLMINRTISGLYSSISNFFENKELSFDENWRRWSAILLIAESKYICYIPIDEKFKDSLENKKTGIELKELYVEADRKEYLEEGSIYNEVEVDAPASDLPSIYNKAYTSYRNELAIIEFATAKVEKLEKTIYAYDVYNKGFIKIEPKENEFVYKPYNQYHVNIEQAIKKFILLLKEQNQRDYAKVIGAITNVCNFEREGNEYGFLLLWSSLEALFRSNQFDTAIGAIKNIIPTIITRRYIYYKLVDFIKDAQKAGVTYSYESREFIKKNPSDQDIETLYRLLQCQEQYDSLADLCKQKYVLLYYKCYELKNMVINAGAISNVITHHKETLEYHLQRMYRVRNKFMHHAEIDKNISALYKHLLVYTWECIREMAYVSETRNIRSLEEIYAYFRMNHGISIKSMKDARNSVDFDRIKNGYL